MLFFHPQEFQSLKPAVTHKPSVAVDGGGRITSKADCEFCVARGLIHASKTRWICDACRVYLHEDCFYDYHVKVKKFLGEVERVARMA